MKTSDDRATAKAKRGSGPLARSVSYDAAADELRLHLISGITVAVPRDLVDELRDVPVAHMNALTLEGDGEVLVSEADDVHMLVPGLLWDLIRFDVPASCWPGKTLASNGRIT